MKKLFLSFAFMFSLVASNQIFAELKIAYVNMPRIMNESQQVKTAQAQIKSDFESKKAQLKSEGDSLVELDKQLRRDFDALSDDQKRTKLEELNVKRRAFLEKENKMLNELNKKRNDKLLEFQNSLLTQVNGIARELGYDLILNDGVLYASPSVDITDKVLARLN